MHTQSWTLIAFWCFHKYLTFHGYNYQAWYAGILSDLKKKVYLPVLTYKNCFIKDIMTQSLLD